MAGAPTALNDQSAQVLLNAVRTGAVEHRAASFAGVHLDTLRAWRRKGEAARAIPAGRRSPSQRRYAEFVTAFDQALSECAVRMQTIVYDTATFAAQTPEDRRLRFQAATWWLSHRENVDYTTRQEITGPDAGPIEIDINAVFDKIARLAGADPDEEDE